MTRTETRCIYWVVTPIGRQHNALEEYHSKGDVMYSQPSIIIITNVESSVVFKHACVGINTVDARENCIHEVPPCQIVLVPRVQWVYKPNNGNDEQKAVRVDLVLLICLRNPLHNVSSCTNMVHLKAPVGQLISNARNIGTVELASMNY